LVTNPPYSGEHKVRLLNFLGSRPDKPFALLLPVYTATKSYWKEFSLGNTKQPVPSSGGNKKGGNNKEVPQITSSFCVAYFNPPPTIFSSPPLHPPPCQRSLLLPAR
jgi:hypothetical protein